MKENSLEKYVWISDEIDKESNRRMRELLSSLSIFKDKGQSVSNSSHAEDGIKHDIKSMAFLFLRAKYALQLIDAGDIKYEKSLKDDIKSITEIIRSLEHEPKGSEMVLLNTATMISALCPKKEDYIKNLICKIFRTKPLRSIQLSPSLGRLFSATVKVYLSIGLKEDYTSLLEYECCLSRRYGDRASHRQLVTAIMFFLCEKDTDTAIHIAEKEVECFDGVSDGGAYQFFWYYGTALAMIGRTTEAEELFKKCYAIIRKIKGDDDWHTLMTKREYVSLAFMRQHGEAERKWLISFVDFLERSCYPEDEKDLAMQIEGKTLYPLLFAGRIEQYPIEQYDRLLRLYEGICAKYDSSNEPLLKKRLSYNLRGGYYFYTGDYIMAERAFFEAIDSGIPDSVPEIISISQIKSNLLMTYLAQQDLEPLDQLLGELMEIVDSDNAKGLSESDKYRIFNVFISRLESLAPNEIKAGDIKDIQVLLNESCDTVISGSDNLPDCKAELSAFMVNAILFFIQNNFANEAEQRMYFSALSAIERSQKEYGLNLVQKAVMYFAMALTAWNLNDNNTDSFVKKVLEAASQAEMHYSIEGAILLNAAGYSTAKGNKEFASHQIEKAFDILDKTWKSCVRYLNDDRLIQILLPAQLQFSILYSLMRNIKDSEYLYEKVLQFKAVASLAGKERNRVIHSNLQNSPLIERIRKAQNKIAASETEAYFRNDSMVMEREQNELRALEAQFAEAFPGDSPFTEITWESVSEALPDNAAVIEYYVYRIGFAELPIRDRLRNAEYAVDIFVTTKHNGRSVLTRIEASADDIIAVSDEFVELLQAKSDDKARSVEQVKKIDEKIDDLRNRLYTKLVAPVTPYIEGYNTVYIAPDMALVNLPIDLLYDYETQTPLSDEHNIIMIECARDFLYKSSGSVVSGGSLIIGDPKYDLDDKTFNGRRNDERGKNRAIRLDSDHISRLPFSLIEAQRIGRYPCSECFTGAMAKKALIHDADKYRILHIATHGYYDTTETTMGMYSSCLLFAGVENWIRDGKLSDEYGNGLLSADEVSRMDLKNIELVVLSSCLSGMSDVIINKGFNGMIGAFSAAGVHYVISHLWSANDFGTAVFMCRFYRYYIEDRMDPPTALAAAKEYLRNVTVGELRKEGWFKQAKQLDLSEKTRGDLLNLECSNDGNKPFKSEKYWGGFACCQCY